MKLRIGNYIANGLLSASRKVYTGKMQEHEHEFFEIEYVLRGSGRYIINGREYPIQERTLFFMSPSDFHEVETDGMEIINVMFSYDLCDTALLFDLFAQNTAPSTRLTEREHCLAESILTEVTQAKSAEYAVQFLRCLLYKLATLSTSTQVQMPSHIRSAVVYILENFRENITLESTARYVGLAPNYLSALFQKETGMGFKKYLDSLRFDYGVKLLQFTDFTVSRICSQSGFCDYANFTRRFKRRYGLTPEAYRKSHQ